MKPWLFVPIALLLGLVLGGWGPRTELRTLREELKTARQAARSGTRHRETNIAGITDMLGIDSSGQRDAGEHPSSGQAGNGPRESSDLTETPDGTSATATQDNADTTDADTGNPAGYATSEDTAETQTSRREDNSLGEEIKRAAELWQARTDIARATFADNVGLGQSEINHFEALTVAMNLRIAASIERFAEEAKNKETMHPEDGIRLGSEVLGAMVITYDAMDESLPTGWRGRAGSEFSLTDFIDPTVATPLIDVEDKLEDLNLD